MSYYKKGSYCHLTHKEMNELVNLCVKEDTKVSVIHILNEKMYLSKIVELKNEIAQLERRLKENKMKNTINLPRDVEIVEVWCPAGKDVHQEVIYA